MTRPLTGIRVLSLSQYMSGPYCTLLLADAGAEVIKVERPGTGDPRRHIPPYIENERGERVAGGFMSYNRGKKSIVLDLRKPEGRELFIELAKVSDVVVENMRPGVTKRLGINYEVLREVNPRLVYAAISGFGQMEPYVGPYTDRPAFDIVVEAMSGIMDLVGYEDGPPLWTIYGLADLYSGLVTAYGIMLALFMRERTGEGQFVDSAMYDNMLSLNERMVMLYSFTGQGPPRGRLRHQGPRGAYKAKDGYLALNVPDDTIWARLCKAIGREDLIEDPRSRDGTARAANDAFLRPIIEAWLADKTRAEAVEYLMQHGVPAGPVYKAEDIFKCPQVKARKMLLTIRDPVAGERQLARTPVLLSAAPEVEAKPAPRLGEHTRCVLHDLLGYDDERIARLEAAGIVATWKG